MNTAEKEKGEQNKNRESRVEGTNFDLTNPWGRAKQKDCEIEQRREEQKKERLREISHSHTKNKTTTNK